MELQLILIAAKLIDIGAVTFTTANQIVVVEQAAGINEKESLFETKWSFFTPQTGKEGWTTKVLSNAYLPRVSEVCSMVGEGSLHAVMQSNFDDALYYSVLPLHKEESSPLPTFGQPVKINLSIPSGINVKIPQNGDWSTPFLSTNRCLFNPTILYINNSEVIVTANTADAAAWFFCVDGQTVIEKTSLKNCLEPSLLDIRGTRLLFFRKSPEGWPLYYNRPATRMAAELLPLKMYKLNKSFAVEETKSDISNGWVTGPSFVYDVCGTDKGQIVLATVTGLVKKPILQILLSDDCGKTWSEQSSVPLDEVPYHLKITVSPSHILTACTFKKHDGYHVMAAEFDR